MDIVGGGPASLLYKNLEKPGLAVNASAGHGCAELHCSFTMTVLANPASVKSLADIEPMVRATLAEFETRGVTDDDLEHTKAGIVSGMIFGLESVSGKVSRLAAYETYRDTPNGISSDVERYRNVTAADVQRVYDQYIKDKPAVIMSIVPEGQPEMIAQSDTWQRYERTIPSKIDGETLTWSAPTDNFDRSVVPAQGEPPTIKAPNVYTGTIEGIPLFGAVNSETPTTIIHIRVNAGQKDESLNKLGLASMTIQMLTEASETMSVEDRANALDKLGSSFNGNASDTYATLTIRSLSDNVDETIAIAVDAMVNPKFDLADFNRVKENQLQSIEASKKNPSSTASNLFNKMVYGADNAYAYPNSGLTETVEAITLDDVREFYETYVTPSIASILVVSDLPQKTIETALAPIREWNGGQPELVSISMSPTGVPGTLYFVDKPGAAQSEIRIGKPSLAYNPTGEFYRATLMNYTLGGAFNSRINLNLREDKGYTYGARGRFIGQKDRGQYRATAGVRSDVTTESVQEFFKEISTFHESGPTSDEIAFTKAAIGQSEARRYETPFQKLNILARMDTYKVGTEHIEEQKALLEAFMEGDADALAAKHLDLDEMFVVIVGDKATQMETLETLSLPIVEVDDSGNPVN